MPNDRGLVRWLAPARHRPRRLGYGLSRILVPASRHDILCAAFRGSDLQAPSTCERVTPGLTSYCRCRGNALRSSLALKLVRMLPVGEGARRADEGRYVPFFRDVHDLCRGSLATDPRNYHCDVIARGFAGAEGLDVMEDGIADGGGVFGGTGAHDVHDPLDAIALTLGARGLVDTIRVQHEDVAGAAGLVVLGDGHEKANSEGWTVEVHGSGGAVAADDERRVACTGDARPTCDGVEQEYGAGNEDSPATGLCHEIVKPLEHRRRIDERLAQEGEAAAQAGQDDPAGHAACRHVTLDDGESIADHEVVEIVASHLRRRHGRASNVDPVEASRAL